MIYGSPTEIDHLKALVNEFHEAFIDNGKPVDIPKEDWMSIPLIPNWEKVDTKLTH